MNATKKWGAILLLCAFGTIRPAAPSPPDQRSSEELPDGYSRLEEGGIVFFIRAGDEAFVQEILPLLQEYRRRADALLAGMRESDAATRETWNPDSEKAKRYFQEIGAWLSQSDQEAQELEEVYRSFTTIIASMHSLFPTFGFERVKIVRLAELEEGRVPLFGYSDQTFEFSFSFESDASGGPFLKDSAENRVEETEFNLSVPLFSETADGRTWEDFADGVIDMVETWAADAESSGLFGEFGALPGEDNDLEMFSTFFLLHEVAELGLMKTLKIEDPLARWFHDGIANFVAHETIRAVDSAEAAEKMPYAVQEQKRFRSERRNVNLLAWARADIDGEPTESSYPHYFYATQEIRGLAERHGKQAIRDLLMQLHEKKPVTTEKIVETIEELTGEDFSQRLQAYCPALRKDKTALIRKLNRLAEREAFARALPRLESLVASDPRNAGYRIALANCLLHLDADRNLKESVFHLKIGSELQALQSAAREGAIQALQEGAEHPAAVDTRHKEVETEPMHPTFRGDLGKVLADAGHSAQGVEVQPDDALLWKELGTILNDNLKDYPAAVEAFQRAVASDANDAAAWADLGNSLKNAGRHAEAVEKLRKAVEIQPDYAWAWRRLGDVFNYDLEDYPAAIEAYQRAVASDANDALALAYLGNSLKNAGRHAEAVEKLRKAVEIQADYAWAWRRLGDVFNNNLEDYPAAVEAYQRAVASDANDAAAWADLGNSLNNAGRHTEAMEKLQKAIELKPDYPWAWNKLSAVYISQNKCSEGLVHADAVLRGDEENIGALVLKGVCLFESARSAEAIQPLKNAVRVAPESVDAWKFLGLAYVRSGDSPSGEEAIRRVLSLEPEDAEAWNALGVCLVDQERGKEAMEALRRALEIRPGYGDARRNLALMLRDAERFGEALEHFRKAVEVEPNSSERWETLGSFLNDHQKDYPAAIEAYQRAVELDVGNAKGWAYLGNSLKNAGRHAEAVEKLRKAVEIQPDHAWAWRRLGDVLSDNINDYLGAIEAYEKATEIDPDDPKAWKHLGSSLESAGMYAEAAEKRRKVVEIQPDNASAWRRLGWVLSNKLEDYPAAIEAYERAVKLEPGHAKGWANLGNSLANAGRYEEALEQLRKAVEVQSDYAWAWRRLGDVLNDKLEDYPAAIEAYQRAVELDARNAKGWAYLGNSLKNADRHAEAVEKLRKAVEIQPDYAWAWRRLGDVFNDDLEDYPAAIEAFQGAVASDANDGLAWVNLGISLKNAGRHAEAVEKLRKAVEIQPDHAEAWRRLGDVFNDDLNDYPAAVEAYQRAVELDAGNTEGWASLGNALANAGRYEEALGKLREATEIAPEDAARWRALGKLHAEHLGQAEASLEAFRKALSASPESASNLNNVAWDIATTPGLRNPATLQEALGLALRACELRERRDAGFLDTLAEVYYWLGETEKALDAIEEAIRLEPERDYFREQKERFQEPLPQGAAVTD